MKLPGELNEMKLIENELEDNELTQVGEENGMLINVLMSK